MKYVGARYMPKFMGNYDATTEYEALSVVDNGLGTSYVANKPVPAGTPLTNTNYWSVYGSTSGAIINLQNQINELKRAYVTPFMYGAAGDGATDDTAALQSCIADNTTIDLCGGSFYITAAIDLSEHKNIEIYNGTIIRDADALHNTFYGKLCQNIYIHDITSDARSNNNSLTYTWPDEMQAFAIIGRSSNIYIFSNRIYNHHYGVCILTADEMQGTLPDVNRSYIGYVNNNYFNNCGCACDLYGKNIEIAYNRIEHITGDGAIIVESEGSTIIDPSDPFSYSDIELSAFNINIHNNLADDVTTFADARKGSEFIIIAGNIVSDFNQAVRSLYAIDVKVIGNNFSNQKNNALNPNYSRFYSYTHTIQISNGEIANNTIVNVCAAIIAAGTKYNGYPTLRVDIHNNSIYNILINAIGVDGPNYSTDVNAEEIVKISDNYIADMSDLGDSTLNYYYRPISIETGRMIVCDNVINTDRAPIRSNNTTARTTLINNLTKTASADTITADSEFTALTNI